MSGNGNGNGNGNGADLIAGFPAEKWQAFTSALEPQYIEQTQGQKYVRHQVCTDTLNRCFGPDGWTLEIKEVKDCDPYTYETREGEKAGRFYAVARVRLTIGKNGNSTFRENEGAQVAGGSREEARKGAISEALKRAASLFGWAPNVYMTEQLGEEWVGDTIMREKKREDEAGFALPKQHETALMDWMTKLAVPIEEQRKVIAMVDCRSSAYALATALKVLAEKPADEPAPKKGKGVAEDAKLSV